MRQRPGFSLPDRPVIDTGPVGWDQPRSTPGEANPVRFDPTLHTAAELLADAGESPDEERLGEH